MTNSKRNKNQQKTRVRKKLAESKDRPRLSVFRSSKHISAQIIDDEKNITLVSASKKDINKKTKSKDLDKLTKTEIAALIGEELAGKAKAKKITKVKFDRGAYKYHGRIKALAESARKGGLIF